MSNENKVTWSQRAVAVISNQMMLGQANTKFAVNSTPEIRAAFQERHRALIEEIFPVLPRGMSAVGAAIARCAIRYGKERAIEFATNVKEMMFRGKHDPCYLYYMWLHNLQRGKQRDKKNKPEAYQMTLAACRAYCEERTIDRLRPATRDVFEWDENWEPVIPRERVSQ